MISHTRTKPGKAAERFFAHSNHQYSVAAITDAAGTVRERSTYDSYGKRTVLAANGANIQDSIPIGNQNGFTGRYHDKETELTFFRARYYSEVIGRFINREPFGKLFGWSYYGYCDAAVVGLENHKDNIAGIDYFDSMSLYQAPMGLSGYVDPSGMQQSPISPQPPRPPRGGAGSGSGNGAGGFYWNGPPARTTPPPQGSTPPQVPPRIYGPVFQPPSDLQPSPHRWGSWGRYEWENSPPPSSSSGGTCPGGRWVWRDYWRYDSREPGKADGGRPHSHPFDPGTGGPQQNHNYNLFAPQPTLPPAPTVPANAPPQPNLPPAREPPTYGPAH